MSLRRRVSMTMATDYRGSSSLKIEYPKIKKYCINLHNLNLPVAGPSLPIKPGQPNVTRWPHSAYPHLASFVTVRETSRKPR